MKVEINRDMRRKIIIYSCSLGFAIILFTLINHLDSVMDVISRILYTFEGGDDLDAGGR